MKVREEATEKKDRKESEKDFFRLSGKNVFGILRIIELNYGCLKPSQASKRMKNQKRRKKVWNIFWQQNRKFSQKNWDFNLEKKLEKIGARIPSKCPDQTLKEHSSKLSHFLGCSYYYYLLEVAGRQGQLGKKRRWWHLPWVVKLF